MMAASIKMLLVIAVSLVAVLIIHALLSRRLSASPRQIVALQAVFAGYLPLAVLLWTFVLTTVTGPQEKLMAIVYAAITYSGFGYFYFHLFNTSETARRIKLIYQIHTSGSIDEQEITAMYNTTEIIRLRLKRLLETGQLRFENGEYSIQGRTLYIGALIVAQWQRVLGMSRNEPAGER